MWLPLSRKTAELKREAYITAEAYAAVLCDLVRAVQAEGPVRQHADPLPELYFGGDTGVRRLLRHLMSRPLTVQEIAQVGDVPEHVVVNALRSGTLKGIELPCGSPGAEPREVLRWLPNP